MNRLRCLIDWIKLSNICIPDVDDKYEYPDFFIIEEFLAYLAMILFLSTTIVLLVPFFEYIDLIALEKTHHWNLFYIAVTCLSIGTGLISTVHTLVKRPITQEHFEWVLSVYRKIEMPYPSKKMTKQDMAIYIDKSLKLDKDQLSNS
ncbi:hypothetical protein PVK63_13820 [Aliivibrio sp. S2TY2]|uniref:hypothetical protein n=1 Tax=unclassified Aliivibrio TaxID=2645654 RepID=UPI0023790E8C|nr:MULTISPECIES: hypothetical protein [unclassified Aliivibrio]MDD9176066.1 hypothetical protein [Aliivibrio sp. S3TY1]MDD9193020.1 hypothetical protein [Aliivibrio sp. S2TY2]